MSWGENIIRWFIPPAYRPDPTARIEEVLEAQDQFREAASATAEVADKSRASIEATTQCAKQRVACQRSPDPRIRAARDALKLLERRQ